MASGSILTPSLPRSNPSSYLQNGHLSPLAHNVTNADELPGRSGSELSEAKDAAVEPPSSGLDSQGAVQDDNVADMATSESSQDEDAEGEADADYEFETAPPAESNAQEAESSSEEEPRRSLKRPASAEDDDYMMNNPELYGLRRSGRARPNRRVVESSSENDDSGSDAVGVRARKKRRSAAPSKASKQPTASELSSTGSGSESDVYVGARRNALTKKQRRRQLLVAAGKAPPSRSEIRFSTRQAAKVTNYNEDDQDSFSEDESELMTPNYWAAGADSDAPAIDVVLAHRLKDDISPGPDTGKNDFEYFIKWQGKAHYHATWDEWANLSSYRGFRRLENYFRKVVTEELYITTDPDVPPEEREKWALDREREADALVEHQQVERIIGTREGDDGTEYYVKWKGLNYDSSTWEDGALVSELAQTEIDRYLDRSSKLPVSNKAESNPNTRRPYQKIAEQPSYIKHGQLREFQIRGVNFLAYHWCKGDNVILADEMGLGKTVQTVSFMNWLRHDRGQQGPFIVVVPLSTMPAWADTFNNWTPDLNYVVYNGNETARKIIREHEMLVDGNVKKVKFNALLTTYEFILQDSAFLSQIKWQFMAVDEAHRLKNRESQLYAKLMEFGAPSRLLITGTPIQNTLGELSALMDFLMPGKVTLDENIDLQSENAGLKLDELTKAIQPYMIRRTKQKVENDLPPKTEKIIRVELSDVQLEYYKNILTRNYAALNAGAKGQKQSLLNIMMELKKASNHPFMFPNAEERILAGSERREDILKALITSSGKMMLLDRLLTKLRKDNHRVLIFSQMVKMLDILGDYLHYRGYQFQRLDGTVAAGPRRMAIDHFNAPDSNDFCFLLSTRAGGLGINLMTADTVIIFDSDWNPQADLQAMARAHRIGQKNPVTIYRLVSKDTVEEEVLERARNKLILEFITIQRGVTDKDAKEFSEKIARAGHGVAEPTSSDDISQILKRRGQKMFEQSGNQKKLEELDIDAVLESAEEHKTEQPEGLTADGGEDFLKSFEYTDVKIDLDWDDIIPKDQLDAIKAEEKKKEDEKYLASVIEQNQPRKRKGAPDDREQRAAKKRAREAAAEAIANDDDEDSTDNDPKRPLNEKEIRNLIKAHERYGSLETRGEEMIRDAKLVGRDPEILKATLDDVLDTARRLLKEEQDKVDAMVREASKSLTKKDKKAILFDYKGVKRLNAETLLERPAEMRMLQDATSAVGDWQNFRVPEASKAAHYTCEWGAREDGMLCVGLARHGFGAWPAIRDDPELGMTDKFFLEEHRVDKKEERSKAEDKNAKSPGAVHLVRRANYLLSVLKDKISNGTNIAAKRAIENHHRNNKKYAMSQRRPDKSASVSASPAPGSVSSNVRKVARERTSDKSRNRAQSQSEHRRSADRRSPQDERNGTPDVRRKTTETDDKHKQRKADQRPKHQSHRSTDSIPNGASPPAHDDRLTRVFRPIQSNLERVRNAKPALMPDSNARLKVYKVELIKIGNFIRKEVREGGSEDQLWNHVSSKYWPKKDATGSQLSQMYRKLLQKETTTTASSGTKDSSARTNGQQVNGDKARVKA
ncbi:ATP-dependent DNA helicase Hrp3 [Coniosporium apollinis]|uniref:ATP-dependent DNA helicase Hrp3 n=2 Tax=Coniosporium TaxID=2810619 RepID=A0ABQ9P2N1_9PEZI|nr:ATP-dependent DNA helicase Hrp3 [Cladosporium sp. JES 115]KAJ9668518.1 ATP-dependent DNA helicase Hrp3 [Coniosporium apollinis]